MCFRKALITTPSSDVMMYTTATKCVCLSCFLKDIGFLATIFHKVIFFCLPFFLTMPYHYDLIKAAMQSRVPDQPTPSCSSLRAERWWAGAERVVSWIITPQDTQGFLVKESALCSQRHRQFFFSAHSMHHHHGLATEWPSSLLSSSSSWRL